MKDKIKDGDIVYAKPLKSEALILGRMVNIYDGTKGYSCCLKGDNKCYYIKEEDVSYLSDIETELRKEFTNNKDEA